MRRSGKEEEISANRTLAVNVAAVVVVLVLIVVGAEVQVLALEVEPLLEHNLGPEHLHRKRISGAYQHHSSILLFSTKKRKRETILKGRRKMKTETIGTGSSRILIELVSC